jgi:2-polyprenyl-3-methyl-5-hydroxy-6-metoxy-1,4-benzoquinol methylase
MNLLTKLRARSVKATHQSGQSPSWDGWFAEAYNEFAVVLDTVRRNTPLASPNGYYPYGTLHILPQILPLLDRHGVDLKTLVAGRAMLDVGCGDGDLGFLLERVGAATVTAIDAAPFNYNGLDGFRALRAALNSQVELVEADIHTLDFSRCRAST